MSNKEEPLSEEQEAELEAAFKPHIKNAIDKIYTPLSWCWPVTIVLLAARWLFSYLGHYELSIWAATIFLWAPLAIVIAGTSLLIAFFYAISLFGSWHRFMQNVAFYFTAGFKTGQEKKEKEEKDDEAI